MEPTGKGKQRTARIPLDYHKRLDGLEWSKLAFAGLAVVFVVAWLWSGWLRSDRGVKRFSPGPLAESHATWEAACTACHTDFQPIRDDTLAASWNDDRLATSFAWRSESDQKCQSCHTVGEHQANQKQSEISSCASCHHEHQGRGATLVRLNDSTCTQCHENIHDHRTSESQAAQAAVPSPQDPMVNASRFDGEHHPAFRSLKLDPGTIAFSHKHHLTAGISKSADDKVRMTLADLPDGDRERYRRKDQPARNGDRTQLVQLDCASCHVLDNRDATRRLSAEPSSRQYMAPIRYEHDCRACHPLVYDPSSQQTVPHGQSPEQIRKILEGEYLREFFDKEPAKSEIRRRPVPGRLPVTNEENIATIVEQQTGKAEGLLRKVCGKCHQSTVGDQTRLSAVQPAQIPRQWLQHSLFNHSAHGAISCRECHVKAYSDELMASVSNKDVLIDDLQTCLNCHGPRTATNTGGARFDCVECHRYHGPQLHGHGFYGGTQVGDEREPLTIREFLNGAPER